MGGESCPVTSDAFHLSVRGLSPELFWVLKVESLTWHLRAECDNTLRHCHANTYVWLKRDQTLLLRGVFTDRQTTTKEKRPQTHTTERKIFENLPARQDHNLWHPSPKMKNYRTDTSNFGISAFIEIFFFFKNLSQKSYHQNISSSSCGLVGYDTCFTRMGSPVRTWARIFFFLPSFMLGPLL